MLITFPRLATITYSDRIITECLKAQKSRGALTFSLEKTEWMDPFAITVLTGTIQCCLQKRKGAFTYVPPADAKLNNYLSQIGFNSFFHFDGKDVHKDTTVELKQLRALEPLYIEALIILINSKMRLSEGMKDSLKMSLQEVLTNVFDHSKSEVGCFVCAQYYPAKNIIRLCITDFGVGIFSNLKDKYPLSTDIDAIKLAVQEGITSRPGTAGFGLAHIRRFLKVNEGTLTIITGSGKVNFYSNKLESYNMSKPFNGTIVNLKINANKESLYSLTSEREYIF